MLTISSTLSISRMSAARIHASRYGVGESIFYFGALAYFLTSDYAYPWFMLALTLITVISFVDDICSTSQKLRLIFHFSAMAMMFYPMGAVFCIVVLDSGSLDCLHRDSMYTTLWMV